MSRRRVAVTGLGCISALGQTVEAFWSGLRDGRSAIGPMQLVDHERLSFKNAAEIRCFTPADHFEGRSANPLDRFAQLAIVAARQAVADAGLEWSDNLRRRTAVITGSCVGGQTSEDEQFERLYKDGSSRLHPLTVPRVMANAGASHISMEFGTTGPAFTTSTACSSSNHAIGHAFWLVRHGLVDLAITGGSEAPFSLGHLKAWEAIRVVAPDTCRPFSKDRKGMILGEGAAMLVLEPLNRALRRGARVYGEVAGFGMSSDAHHLTQPSVEGPAAAMLAALDDGRLDPGEIGYINAHGTATQANDPAESRAIRRVFGAHADELLVSSTKSMHGHTLGAAGAIEAVATLLSLHAGLVPPTANYSEPDPECDLDVVPNESRTAAVTAALSNSFAFGGLNAVLAFRGPDSHAWGPA